MPDRTWAPEVVDACGRAAHRAFFSPDHPEISWGRIATAALSASPLPAALDILERCANLLKIQTGTRNEWIAEAMAIAHDAAAFVARVGEGS